MTTQSQTFDAYAEGAQITDNFSGGSGGDTTNATWWHPNNSTTQFALAAANMVPGGVRGAKQGGNGAFYNTTQGVNTPTTAGVRVSASTFFKVPSGTGVSQADANTLGMLTVLSIADGPSWSVNTGAFVVNYAVSANDSSGSNGSQVLSSGVALQLDQAYLLRIAVTSNVTGWTSTSAAANTMRLEAEIWTLTGSTLTRVFTYDSGFTRALTLSGGKMNAWGYTTLSMTNPGSSTASVVAYFDYPAWSNSIAAGAWPGYTPPSDFVASVNLSGSGTLTTTGSAISPLYPNSTANTKYNTFEGLTNGTAITTANSGGASGTALSSVTAVGTGSSVTAVSMTGWDGAATIAAALTQGGTNSVTNLYWLLPTSLNGRFSASFFAKISALPPTGGKAMIFGFGNSAQLLIDSTGRAALWLGGNSTITGLATSAGAWVPDRWYFVQVATKVGDASTATADDTLELRIYDTTTGTALIEGIATTLNFGPARTSSPAYFGDAASGTAYPYTTYFDNISASGDHPFPGGFPYLSNVTNVSTFDEYPEGAALLSDFGQAKYGQYWVINGNMTASANSALEGGRGVRAAGANNIHAIAQNYNADNSGHRVAASFYIRFNNAADLSTGANTSIPWATVNGNSGVILSTGNNSNNVVGTLNLSQSNLTRLASSPTVTVGTWYFSQVAVTVPNPTSATSRVEWRLWKQDSDGSWSKVTDYDSGATLSFTFSGGKVLDWGIVNGTSSSTPPDYDTVAWSQYQPFGFPGDVMVSNTIASTGTASLTGSGTLSTTAVTNSATTGQVGVDVAVDATPVTGNATVSVNVNLGSSAESVFPTGVFRHAGFDGSGDDPFTQTVGAVAYGAAYAFPGAIGGYSPASPGGMSASGTSTAYVSWAPTGPHDNSRKSASFYFNLSTIPDLPISILQLGNVASVIVRPDGTIGFNSPGLSTPPPEFWSTVPLEPNTWYFVQFAATNTGTRNDRGELRVYGLADVNAATRVLEVDQAGLDFGIPPAPATWFFGRAGTTTSPVSVRMDYLYATDIYRSIDFPGIDSTVNSLGGFGDQGSSYYQDFNNMSPGTGIVTGNPGSGASLPFASPAPNSATSETDESDYFVYTLGDVAATTDSAWEGSTAARMSLHSGGQGATVGWFTVSSFGDTWGDRGATFAAFRLDSLATYPTGDFYQNEFVALTGLLLGSLVLQPRTGRLAYENPKADSLTENGTAIVSAPLQLGTWYVLRYATNFHIDGTNLRETLEIRQADTGAIFHYVDTGIYQMNPPGNAYQNIVSYGVANGHWASDWSMTWDRLILRQQWAGAGYPGPLYPEFEWHETEAAVTANVGIAALTEADTGISDVTINVGVSAEVDSNPVVLDDTEYIPQPYGTVQGYIDGITINGASSSFTMSTEFTQYATGDMTIPPVTSGSPYGAVDLCWQLAGNMRGRISEGNYWSLQGHEAGFDLKSKELLTGRDESRYKLFNETFDKDGIPRGGVYRNWKVLDSYTSSGWYAWAGDGIYSTAGKGSSPTVKVGTRTNIICTARPAAKSVQFNFGNNLTDCGFGPHNASFAFGKWFAVTISTGAVLLEGQWGEVGKTVATDFSKTASLTGLNITDTSSVRVLIGIDWVSSSQLDVTVIVANATETVTISQSMTNTALDLFARQWGHVGAIRGLYQHTVARNKMTLASFATKPYEGAVPVEVRLPSLGIDTEAQILGTSGSLWDYLTQIAVARQVDIRNQDGTILLTPMTDVARQAYFWEPVITPSFALGVDNVAQTVEIVQNIATWKPLGTLYDSRKATDSFSVTAGQTATFSITVSASPSLLYNPAPVGGTSTLDPVADALRDISEFRDESKHIFGAYTVQGTLDGISNHTVPAQEWIAYGGSVTVVPVDQTTIQMTVVAPNMPGWSGDFQLGLHADQDYPLVRLVGDGTTLKTKTLRFNTGANPSNTVTASQITNVAATTRRIVNTLVARASTVADGPSIALSATISMAEVRAWGLSLGTIPGSTLLYRNIQWRVLSATVQNASVAVEARPYSTYKSDYWHHNWDGASYFDFKTYWSGKKWDDFKVSPLGGPSADFHYRGPLPKFTLYPAPDANEFTPLLEPADDLLASRDLLPSGGFSDPGTPPPYPSADLWPGAEIDPYAN